MNRVTDTCIPEDEAMRHIETAHRSSAGSRPTRPASATPRTSTSDQRRCAAASLAEHYQIDPQGLLAARRRREEPADLRPRLGGLDPRQHLRRRASSTGDLKPSHVRQDRHRADDAPRRLVHRKLRRASARIGFFQIGGGIAGDFAICVVPMIHQDLEREDAALGLLLPDLRLRRRRYGSYSRRRPQREDHLGQARRRHAEAS